jgi:sortase A
MLWWAGAALAAVGLVILAFGVWQYVGTNWISQRKHQAAIADLDRAWQQGEPTADTDDGLADAIIRIPRFGDDYAVPVLEGTDDDVLAAGFGHFADSASPGEVGNFAVAAHRVTHGEPLRGMPDLEVGDEVVVETAATTYTYELVSDGDALVVPFSEGWVVEPRPTNPDEGEVQPPRGRGQRLLTLTTCSELFHTDNRMVAFGVLESAEPK